MSVEALSSEDPIEDVNEFAENTISEKDELISKVSKKIASKESFSSKDLSSRSLLFRKFENLSREPNSCVLSRPFSLASIPDKSSLPDDFNLESSSFSRSRYYDLKLPELDLGEIGFINGILTEYNEAEKHAFFLSSLANGRNIHGVYKANRPLNLELFESFCELDTTPVFLLQNQWRAFFSQHPDLKYLQICHSQGALHVKKALMGLSEEERKKIIVVAIAPQVLILGTLCFKADNYLSTHDFIPFLNGKELKQSLASEIHIRNPAKKAPLWDHDFESPSYREGLKFHIESYLQHPEG